MGRFPKREVAQAANRRYLEFLSQLSDPSAGMNKVARLSEPVRHNARTYRGFNLFATADLVVLRALFRGEFALSGVRNAWLRRVLPHLSGAQASRLLKRLHLHGLLKKVAHTYKYHLSTLGREAVLSALKLREFVVIPTLATLAPA